MRRISVGHIEIGPKEREAVIKVLDSHRISEGDMTREFEEKWASFIGSKYCVATSSGTAALITILSTFKYLYSLDKRPKIITSPLTYISDANAITLTGFQPVFVDIDPVTFCITPENIRKHLESVKDPREYSAILAVDLMGFPARIDEIRSIAEEFKLFVIDDAAEAHGTVYKGKKCGSNSNAGVFSFYIAHNLSAGEMGAITMDDYELYHLAKKIKSNGRYCKCKSCTRHQEKCPTLHNYGGNYDLDPRFLHDVVGYNFKVMEFQSAIASVQIDNIGEIIKKRQENVRYLNSGLRKFNDILQLPFYDDQISYLAYPVVIRRTDKITRRDLRLALEKKRIETRPLFGCIPTQQPAYYDLRNEYLGKLPNAEYIGASGFYIGCHQYLVKEDLDYIIAVFSEIFKNNG
jgi:dTDP-4-amino-4,6-dideoxygalactose transaminase